MRIGFYAPMKPLDHPNASGDRQMGRLIVAALEAHGHEVHMLSTLRTWMRAPDAEALAALRDAAAAEIARLTAAEADKADLYLTYHLYHKAPDLIGPALARAHNRPYAIVEASHAEHRRNGPWHGGLIAAEAALEAADAVGAMHEKDRRGLSLVVPEKRLVPVPPFIDAARFAAAPPPASTRASNTPARLLTVAMMRGGDKLASYSILAQALARLAADNPPFTLTIVGDGPERETVEALFAGLPAQFLGQVENEALPDVYAAHDLFVWPAVNEAFGLVFLEAQAAGCPVVGARFGGVPDIVAEGETGLIAPANDVAGFAEAVAELLATPARRRAMATKARHHATDRHDMRAGMAHMRRLLDMADQNFRQRQ